MTSAPPSPPDPRPRMPFSSTSSALIDERQLHFAGSLRLQQARQATSRKRRDQREQLGPQDVALAHVDDAVRFLGVEAEHRAASRPSTREESPAGGCSAATDADREFRSSARAAPARSRPATRDSRDTPHRRHAGAGIRRTRESGGTAGPGDAARAPAPRRRAAHRPGRRTARDARSTSRRRRAPQCGRSVRAQARERAGIAIGEVIGDHLRSRDFGRPAMQPDAGAGGFERRHPARAHCRDRSRQGRRPCPRSPATPARAARKPSLPSGAATSVSGPCRPRPRPTCAQLPGHAPAWSLRSRRTAFELALMRGDDRILAP